MRGVREDQSSDLFSQCPGTGRLCRTGGRGGKVLFDWSEFRWKNTPDHDVSTFTDQDLALTFLATVVAHRWTLVVIGIFVTITSSHLIGGNLGVLPAT